MTNEKSINEVTRNYTTTLLLAFFLGGLGIHRFYTGYTLIGILQLLTGGGCGIWALIDLFSICTGHYEDADNLDLADYNPSLGTLFMWIAIILIIVSLFIIF